MEARKLKRRIVLLQIFSFIASIAPLAVAAAMNWNDYIKEPSDAVKLSLGGIIVAVLFLLKAIGKLKMPKKRVIAYLLALVVCYLLSVILDDIVFLLGMATLGEVIDLVFFQRPIRKMKEALQLEKTGEVVGDKLENILQKYLGGKAK
jgi:hypothetical protein